MAYGIKEQECRLDLSKNIRENVTSIFPYETI
jgi:hypothetical protein